MTVSLLPPLHSPMATAVCKRHLKRNGEHHHDDDTTTSYYLPPPLPEGESSLSPLPTCVVVFHVDIFKQWTSCCVDGQGWLSPNAISLIDPFHRDHFPPMEYKTISPHKMALNVVTRDWYSLWNIWNLRHLKNNSWVTRCSNGDRSLSIRISFSRGKVLQIHSWDYQIVIQHVLKRLSM